MFESEIDERLRSSLQNNKAFSLISCASKSELLTMIEWEPPDVVVFDERSERFCEGRDEIGKWLSLMYEKQWFLPVLLFSDDAEVWAEKTDTSTFVLPSHIETDALVALVQEQVDAWEVKRMTGPVSFRDLLSAHSSRSRTSVVLAELENGETAILEFSEGDLWRVELGTLRGDAAFRRIARFDIVATKIKDVVSLPHSSNVKLSWKDFWKQSGSDVTANLGRGLETRSSVDQMSLQELIPGFEETLKQAQETSGLASLCVPNVRVPPLTPLPGQMKAPSRELFKLLELLVSGDLQATANHVTSLQGRWPGEPSLHYLWVRGI